MGHSGSVDSHRAVSEEMDDRLAESAKADDRRAEAEEIDDRLATGEDLDERLDTSETMGSHRAGSRSIESLSEAAPASAAAQEEELGDAEARAAVRTHRAARSLDARIASIHDTKLRLAAARERARAADAAYQEMERRQHPRGDARQKILDERDLAHRDLEAILAEYDALLGDTGSE